MMLSQAMSYRTGHHSTSDDSSRYRTSAEMQMWRARDPAARFARWLASAGWWDETREAELSRRFREEVSVTLTFCQHRQTCVQAT